MQHSFDKDIAVEYGIIEAILLNHICYWLEKNEANDVNYYDGSYWTYNTIKAFNKLFPYFSERQIQNALKHLKEENIIKTGNYNASTYDRTLWYTFTEKGTSIMQKCKMENKEMLNGNVKNVEPIPYIKPNNKPNNNIYSREEKNVIKEIIDYLNLKLGTHYKYTTKATQKLIKAKLNEGYTLEDFKTVIDKKTNEWLDTDMAKFLRPSTLFAGRFDEYLNQKEKKENQPTEITWISDGAFKL